MIFTLKIVFAIFHNDKIIEKRDFEKLFVLRAFTSFIKLSFSNVQNPVAST